MQSNYNTDFVAVCKCAANQIIDNQYKILMKTYLQTIFFLIIINIAQNSKIPCEFVTPYTPNRFLKLSDREIIVPTRYGFDMIVDFKDESVSNSIRRTGSWQPQLLEVITMFVRQGDNVVNLGSQSGLEAIKIGKMIGPKGKLFIFEPYSVSHDIVLKNIYLNNLQDITTIYQVGASDIQSQALIRVYYQNTGGAEILLGDFPKSAREVEEQTVFIDLVDNVLPDHIKLDFALIDVQKMEIQALLGMRKVIAQSADLIIMLEWQYGSNPRRNEKKALKLLSYLIERGYRFYRYYPAKEDCTIGSFEEITDKESLMTIPELDLFLLPDHLDPNHFRQR